jgi:hypothetical protein
MTRTRRTSRSTVADRLVKAIKTLHLAGYLWTDTIEDEYKPKVYCFQGAAKSDPVQIELDIVNVLAAGDFYERILNETEP